ncbi:MAG: hypothetical protein C5B47_01410 [Verrucomicrobia bacterium]|nr:MAG: hypothetical protein C5B47_01410 [Verrucomicrobiota bacterium]
MDRCSRRQQACASSPGVFENKIYTLQLSEDGLRNGNSESTMQVPRKSGDDKDHSEEAVKKEAIKWTPETHMKIKEKINQWDEESQKILDEIAAMAGSPPAPAGKQLRGNR